MPSLAEIVNQVLTEFGRLPIPDYTQDSSGILIANRVMTLLPELLLRTDWNFAIKYVTDDSPLSVNISPEYLYNYQLPPDYDRMDRVSWFSINFGLVYRIIDGVIMCNVRPIQYYYVVNNIDLNVMTPVFYRALVLYVAATTCSAITNDEKLRVILEKLYQQKMVDAIRQNDMDRMVVSTPYNDFGRPTYI